MKYRKNIKFLRCFVFFVTVKFFVCGFSVFSGAALNADTGENQIDLQVDDQSGDGETTPELKRPEIPFTVEEMAEVIRRRLKVFSEIVYMIENLNAVTDEKGTEYFYTKDNGDIVALEDLDKDEIHKIFVRVNNEATRLNTERLMKQLQQQNALMHNIQQQQQQAQRQAAFSQQTARNAVPSMPQVVTPPRVYQPPQQPSQPPRVYQPPQPPPSNQGQK